MELMAMRCCEFCDRFCGAKLSKVTFLTSVQFRSSISSRSSKHRRRRRTKNPEKLVMSIWIHLVVLTINALPKYSHERLIRMTRFRTCPNLVFESCQIKTPDELWRAVLV